MNIAITFSDLSSTELERIGTFLNTLAVAQQPSAVIPSPSAPIGPQVGKPKAMTAQPVKAAEPETTQPEDKAEAPAISLVVIREKAKEKAKVNREGVKKVLDDLGASSVSTLDPAKYSDFITAIEAL